MARTRSNHSGSIERCESHSPSGCRPRADPCCERRAGDRGSPRLDLVDRVHLLGPTIIGPGTIGGLIGFSPPPDTTGVGGGGSAGIPLQECPTPATALPPGSNTCPEGSIYSPDCPGRQPAATNCGDFPVSCLLPESRHRRGWWEGTRAWTREAREPYSPTTILAVPPGACCSSRGERRPRPERCTRSRKAGNRRSSPDLSTTAPNHRPGRRDAGCRRSPSRSRVARCSNY